MRQLISNTSYSTLSHLLESHLRELHKNLEASEVKRIYNLSIPHLALLLAFLKKQFIVIEDSDDLASNLYRDLIFFCSIFGKETSRIHYFPPLTDNETAGKRAKSLLGLKGSLDSSIITSKEALSTGYSLTDTQSLALRIFKNQELDRQWLERWLLSQGYKRVSMVIEKGEFSSRGWIFDIFPVTEEVPVRIEYFGDNIDLIRTFDIETQRSINEIEGLTIYSASEPEQKNNLLDLADFTNSNILFSDSCSEFLGDYLLKPYSFISFNHLPFVGKGIDSMEYSIKGLGILPEERMGIEQVPPILKGINKKIVAVFPSLAQAERFRDILADGDIIAPILDKSDIGLFEGRICITTGRLSSGLNLHEMIFLTDREIFGEGIAYRPIRRSKVSKLLLNYEDLNPGDYIVHRDHGIGRFIGLDRQKAGDYEEDLIIIEYANGRLFVPFHNINKLQKYTSSEGHVPHINKLGGKEWERTKQRVKKGISDMADKLLKLYAERKVSRGFAFSEDTPLHREFDDFFPYEETPDQIRSIEEIKRCLYSDVPMDMLLCGDVGYGKTEVAMRAAFRAVYDGKQVIVLVPSTLLSEQHHKTFKIRFSGFPVRIECLNRFKKREEIKRAIKAIADGEVDIIIGTHMLLKRDIKFYDPGLLIIDEEHRFGVAQKERLKEFKKNMDVLTLTATPIPRTLQMSLSGIRQMCTIETPPEERLSVRSIVTVFNQDTIREAIEREIKRGGQVFFVHNRILDIEKIAGFIKGILPNLKIGIAHSRMREIDLEGIMLRFLNREIDVLVSTAIIGSGLDIPNANTIIINRADTFGLSDLYQLRGRVGRSNVQAFAYFLIPGEDIITDEAKKRLKAIQEMSYLGAGFRLALKDLEIRGAGNLLGAEQSGHIYKVGFDMYMEMLEKAVAELRGEEVKEEIDPQIRFRISAFIPEDYIPDAGIRLSIYRRISTARTRDALIDIRGEIIDRFGRMPREFENLLTIMNIKILARHLFISNVTDSDGRVRFTFVHDPENRYKMPENFFDKILKRLFELQGKERIRFLPDGFELDTRTRQRDVIIKVEKFLINLGKTV